MSNRTESVAWECPACGHRHLWQWDQGEATCGWPITMHCDHCHVETLTELVQIGATAFAALWPEQ